MDEDMILPEGFDLPVNEPTPEPQETPVEEFEQGNVDEPTSEPTEPLEPTQEPTAEPPKIRVKVDREEREISVEEAAILAQKGMNYERAVERAAQQARDAVIAEMGMTWNGKPITTESEYKQAIAEQKLIEQYKDRDLPPEVIQELVENRKFREQQQQEKATQAEQAKKQADLNDFFKYFESVNERAFDPNKDNLPAEVLQAVENGATLKYAYMEHHNKELRNRLKIQSQNQENKRKAPVSGVTINGGKPPVSEDLFLRGFNSI